MLEKQPSGYQSYENLIEMSEEDDSPAELRKEVDNLFKKLIELFPQRSLSIIGKFKMSGLNNKEDTVAMIRAAESHPSYVSAWTILSRAQLSSSANKAALDLAEKGLLKLDTRAKRSKAKLTTKRVDLLLLKAQACEKLQNKGECGKSHLITNLFCKIDVTNRESLVSNSQSISINSTNKQTTSSGSFKSVSSDVFRGAFISLLIEIHYFEEALTGSNTRKRISQKHSTCVRS